MNIDEKKDYIFSDNLGLFHLKGINDKKALQIKLNSEEKYIGIIKLTDNIYAFSSNSIYNKGKNVLSIYNINKQNSEPQIINDLHLETGQYSFNTNNNSLYLINIDNTNELLLCACKSYNLGSKNGIMLSKLNTNKFPIKLISLEFYDTEDFEISCFCSVYENKDRRFVYVLVGGFESDKKRGMVKLYKIYHDVNDDRVKLEYIQDAIENSENNVEFDGTINNIIRPKEKKRDVIVSCYKGSNYLFKLPRNDKFYEDLMWYIDINNNI